MPVQGSFDRPRTRACGFGCGAAGALLRAAGALPTNRPVERKFQPKPGRQDAIPMAREVAVEVPKQPESVLEPKQLEPEEAEQKRDQTSTIVDVEHNKAYANFLEFCLGGPAAVLDVEVHRAAEESKSAPEEEGIRENYSVNQMFCTDSDNETEDDDDNPDLEDMFDFDPTRLAELVNKGAGLAELTDHLQTSYAEVFEQRIGAQKPVSEEQTFEEEQARISIVATNDVLQLMTPEQVTPVVTPTGSSGKSVRESLADCADAFVEKRRHTEDRKRRSIAIQQRPSIVHRRDSTVKAMEAFGRRSLANAPDMTGEERALLEGAVSDAVRRASRHHRRSVTMATEVLEEAADASNLPLSKWSDDQIDNKVELIQNAMDEAYRRHTQSITDAVHNVVANRVNPEPSSQENDVMTLTIQERIANAVSAAYQRRNASSDCYSQWDSGYNGNQDLWSQQEQWPGYGRCQQEQCFEWFEYEPCQQEQWSDQQQWQAQEQWSQHDRQAYEPCQQEQWSDQQQWQPQMQWSQHEHQTCGQKCYQEWHPPLDLHTADKIAVSNEHASGFYANGIHAPWRYGSA